MISSRLCISLSLSLSWNSKILLLGRIKLKQALFCSALAYTYLCHYEDRMRFGIAKSEMKFPFVSALTFRYICCNLKYLIWLSTLCRKLAWERATDKKMPDCSESLYSSCFQITLCFDAKIAFFLRIPEFSGYKFMMNQWNNLYRTWQAYRSRVPLTTGKGTPCPARTSKVKPSGCRGKIILARRACGIFPANLACTGHGLS